MNKAKLQRLFVDFILNEVGPNEEKEKERNTKYNLVKQIIENSLMNNYPNYIPHLFLYGSFSIKTYLKDSDIDIFHKCDSSSTSYTVSQSRFLIRA